MNWAADWTLSSIFALTGNMQYEWSEDGGQRFSQATAVLSLGLTVSQRWGGFVEIYGHNRMTKDGDPVSVADLGVTYLLSPKLQLDVHFGRGLQKRGPDRWGGLGVSYRF